MRELRKYEKYNNCSKCRSDKIVDLGVKCPDYFIDEYDFEKYSSDGYGISIDEYFWGYLCLECLYTHLESEEVRR
jgi:hypothetical protein